MILTSRDTCSGEKVPSLIQPLMQLKWRVIDLTCQKPTVREAEPHAPNLAHNPRT